MCARDIGRFGSYALAMLVAGSLFAASANAQNTFGSNGFLHGVPPSVTSFGFGGDHGFHGVRASVTSPGFGNVGFNSFNSFNGFGRPTGFGFHHRRHSGFINPFFGGTVYVPYAYPVYVMDTGIDDSMEQDYSSGPTIFDRSGPSRPYYHEAAGKAPEHDYRDDIHSRSDREPEPEKPAAEPQPVAEQPQTVLVFKDGHQVEVKNYAIVGVMLFDLSEGRTHKIALAELDLPATMKQNDERGVDFQLPAGTKLN